MGSLDKNGSAIDIDCIAKDEKMDAEKNSEGKDRTYGVERVGTLVLGAAAVCKTDVPFYFRIRACG